jgi:acyl-CoA thioester hydrolase
MGSCRQDRLGVDFNYSLFSGNLGVGVYRHKEIPMIKQKIYYHHTDSGGVVYYANYLNFLEEARTEFFTKKGFSVKDLALAGTMFVVARQEVDYKAPAVYGDILEIRTKVTELSAVKIIFENEIYNQNNQLLTKAKTVLVCVDKSLKPQAIPSDIRSKFSQ